MSGKGAGRYGVYFGNVTFKEHPYFTQSGKDRENNPDQYIANMRDGAIAGFKYFIIKDLKEIAIQVRGNMKGYIHVTTALNSEPITSITVQPTKGFTYFFSKAKTENAKQALYFTFQGTGKLDFLSFVLW